MSLPDSHDVQDKVATQYPFTPKSKKKPCYHLLTFTKFECSIWILLPRYTWPEGWNNIEEAVVPLERKLHGHPLASLLWVRHGRQFPNGFLRP